MKHTLIIVLLLVICFAAKAQDPRIDRLFKQGMAYEKASQYEQANRCYRQIAFIYDSLSDVMRQSGTAEALKNAKRLKENADWQRMYIIFIEMKIEASTLSAAGDLHGLDRCYNRMIAHLKQMGLEKLATSIEGAKSINLTTIGMQLMQKGQFANAMPYMDSALVYTQPKDKNYRSAHRWKARACEIWGTELLSANGSREQVDSLYRTAEKHFAIAGSTVSALDVRNTRATMIQEAGQYAEALTIFGTVVNECGDSDSLSKVKSEALYHIGEIELKQDKIPQAIADLQRAYELAQHADNRQIMFFSAEALRALYRSALPDRQKEALWGQRADQIREAVAATQSAKTTHRFAMDESEKELERKTKLVEANKSMKNKRYDEAIVQFTALIAEFESQSPVPLEDLSTCYSLRSAAHTRLSHIEDAAADRAKAIALAHKTGHAEPSEMNTHWYSMAILLYRQGKQESAMHAADSCVAYAIAAYGPMHIETLESRSLKANIMAFYGARQAALDEERQCLKIIRHNTQQNYLYLTQKERANYWDKLKQEGYTMAAFAYKMGEWQSDFTDEMYNQQLLAKGLLLNTDRQLKEHIDNDKGLKTLFGHISALRHKADSAGISRSEAEAATLEADRLERSLTAKIYNSRTSPTEAGQPTMLNGQLTADVGKLRSKMQSDQAAVEFIDFRIGKDSVMYGALLLTPHEAHVRFIPLFEQRDTAELSSQLWSKLQQACGAKTRRIYFAASGLLYMLPIESYRHDEKLHLYRLSSTRLLADRPAAVQGRGAVIYGGIRYSATIQEMSAVKRLVPPTDTSNHRYAMKTANYLKGTLEEARKIKEVLDAANRDAFQATKIEGVEATETTFKNLDGQRTRIIHIATHGFYNDTQKVTADDIDAPLRRSGLLFAGANNTLQDEAPPNDVDDGILTGAEIEAMDLSGLDLVVLSACETGKGNITSDGVFGLQRAFKKAGAQSIIMSLWKVDDEATKELMSQFYSNWMEGMSKHEALEAAKKSVRDTPKWRDPKYWAAFILLDATE